MIGRYSFYLYFFLIAKTRETKYLTLIGRPCPCSFFTRPIVQDLDIKNGEFFKGFYEDHFTPVETIKFIIFR